MKKEQDGITEYWLEHYLDRTLSLCSLCGNSGIIDTTKTAVSPAGFKAGRKNFCLCPNGQAMRERAARTKKRVRPSPFDVPSEFMRGLFIPQEIKVMPLLEMVERLHHEVSANGNLNWKDEEPETCWFRALAVTLGERIYKSLNPEKWGDWQDEFCCFLTGVAGYDDDDAFHPAAALALDQELWSAIKGFVASLP